MPPPDLQPLFEEAAAEYGVPVNVLAGLAQQESTYRSDAVGVPTKWGRAKGMLQYIDPTANSLGIDPLDTQQSIRAAAKQMRERLDKGDSMQEAVMAHHGGDNRRQWGPKTRRYGNEVLSKADQIGKGLMEQGAAAEPQAPEPYDLKAIQAELDAKEPGRYRVLDPEEVAGNYTKREDIASGRNGLANAADGMKNAPSPLTMENQTKFKQQGQPSPLTIANQLRKAAGLPTGNDAPPAEDDRPSGAGSYLKQSGIAGLYDLAGSGAKILDAVNPWTFTESEIATIYKDQPEKYQDYLDNSAGMILNRFAKRMTKNSEEAMAGISEDAKRTYGEQKYATTDWDESAFKTPVKIIGDAVRSLPSTAALAVTAFMTRGAAQRAEAQALAAGASPEAARQIAVKAAVNTATKVGAVSEGAIGYAMQSEQTQALVDKTTDEMMAKSPRYKELLAEGFDPKVARGKVVSETAEESGKYAGIVDAATNLVGGEFLGRIIAEGGTFIGRVMRGAANEGAIETVQSSGEQAGQNLAIKNNVDPSQSLSEGTGEAAVQGLAVGGLTGGVVTGVIGGRSNPADPTATPGAPPADTTPAAEADATPAADVPAEVAPAPVVPPAGPLVRAAAQAQPEVMPEAAPVAEPEASQPPAERVTIRGADGEMPGVLEAYQEDGQGGWSARVLSEDGNSYDFTQDDGVTLDREAAPAPAAPAITEEANAQSENPVPESVDLGAAPEVAGTPNEPAANRSEADLRAELKAVAAQIRTDKTNTELKARRKEIEKAINEMVAPKTEPTNSLSRTASWVIRNKETGEVIMETFDKKKVDALNTEKYEAVPIGEHLGGLNNGKPKAVPESIVPTPKVETPELNQAARVSFGGRKIKADENYFDTPEYAKIIDEHNRLDEILGQIEDGDYTGTLTRREVRKAIKDVELNDMDLRSEFTGIPDRMKAYKEINRRLDDDVARKEEAKRQPKVDAVRTIPTDLSVSATNSEGSDNHVVTLKDKDGKIHYRASVYVDPENPGWMGFQYVSNESREHKGLGAAFYTELANYAASKGNRLLSGVEATAPARKVQDEMIASGAARVIAPEDAFPAAVAGDVKAAMEANPYEDGGKRQLVEILPSKAKATTEESSVVQTPSEYGSKNKLVSQDRAAELRAKLKAKLNGSQLNAGIDPEVLAMGTELAVFHIEAGVRKFADFARAMASDLDLPLDKVRPYLRSWFNGARDMMEDAGHSVEGMDSAETVRAELANLTDAPAPAAKGKRETVTTPSGREFEVQHKVVEADSLTTSNNADGSVNPAYPQELQPRDRGRSASIDQINDIASKLNPRLLGESASATDGAPIVSPEGVVESGNGRTLAIRQAYARNPETAAKYREWLKAQGHDVDGMKAPVLVRERVTPMDTTELQAYTAEANDRTTLAMSSTERALGDAKKIVDILHLYRGGDVQGAANRDFVRSFMGEVAAKSDRGSLVDSDGLLSQEGRRRIEAALLAAAYGDANIVTDLFESSESDIKAIGGALLDVSGEWAQMRREAGNGTIPSGVDVTPNLMEAVNIVRRARAEGRPVYELVNQTDIFSGDLSPETKAFMSVFYRGDSLSRARGRDKVAGALLSYTQQAREAKPGDNLFGDPEVSGTDIIRGVNEKLQRQEDNSGQASLFGGASDPTERAGGTGREGQRPGAEAQGQPATQSGEDLNGTGRSERVERDSQEPGTSEPVVQAADGDVAGQADGSAGRAGDSAGAGRASGKRDQRLPADGAATVRERGDQLVHQPDGQFRSEDGTAGSAERAGSGSDSIPGTPVEQQRAERITETAPASDASEFAQRLEAQRKADKAPTKRGDKASIDAALPLLMPAQRDDVLKAEVRFANANGMLLTNGTGTGKTASGLGAAKRSINEGKDSIIVVVPSDKIASDWVKFAGMMGIDLKPLADTKDNGGKGPVITTYANFAANDSLALRKWDMAITDEAHYLSSNEAGETTGALEQLRALTGHHGGFYKAVRDQNPKAYAKLQAAIAARPTQEQMLNYSEIEQAAFDKAIDDARAKWEAIEKPARKAWDERWAKQDGLPKTLFLSATPFPYVKNVDYAEGYLFDYVKPADLKKSEGRSAGYNSGSPRDQFLMQHFGYRMRTNKLTAPEAGVDSELMEQNFNQWLKDNGALSGRRLEVPFDYDRKFAMVEDAVGQKIDQGLKYLREEGDGKYRKVYDAVMAGFDYQSRMYLLESIKARAVIPMIKDHLALGRKVVVFHDYNKGGGFDPFKSSMPDEETRNLAREAFSARPDLFKLKLTGLNSPIETIGAAFDDVLFFNGTVPKKKRRENADAFNNDNGDNHLMVVQSDAGREGVSLHDTTGKHQRVLINLGMPGKPVAAIQIEGRTYRTGQASDAVFRYLTTGTAWEASAFASKIAERASTAENLALGTDARGLKQSFIDSYNDADLAPASAEDGKGGKAYDRDMASGQQLSGFNKAKTYYFAQQKNTRRRDQREGVDYFATPEPVGFKMAEWANIQQGDKVLEPSAGHGAIARFFPARTDVTMVEPSYELSQRAALANGSARIVNEQFEDLHISNKYDAIVMNPPYGSGGKTAIEHVAKAAKHLRDAGRVVALIPRGGITDKRLAAFMESEDAANLYLVAKIDMPASTFERAGTAVNTQVLVFEKHVNPADAEGIQQRNIDLSNAENITELFNRIEEIGMPDRKPSSKPEPKEEIVEHTTGKGKVLRGMIRKDLTKAEAQEIDPYTFPKNGGFFIRAKYLDQGKQSVDAYRGFNADIDGAKFSVQPDGLRSLVEAEPLDLAVSPELAARPLAEVRAEAFTNMLANRTTTMTHPSVGTITFNRAGITKSRSTSNDPAKVLTMSNLDEIVSEAAYLGRSEPEGDSSNIVRYHYLGRRLTVDGEPMVAMITLRENADGKISYYNHSMLQDAPTIESVTAPVAANDNAKYQRPALRMERMSLSDAANATPGQVARISDALTEGKFGKAVSRLINSGRVVLHETAATLPGKALPGTQAMTMPDGTVHLVAENLTPQTAMPVLLHEMFHSGGESLVGSKRWKGLQGRLSSLHRQFSNSPGKAGDFFAAAARVKDAQRAGNTMSEALTVEEFGAYAIEQYENAPATIRKWVDDVIGAIKEFMFRQFGIQLGQVSPSQLRAMAVEAIRSQSTASTASSEIRYSVKPSKFFDDLNDKQKEFLDKIGPERLPQRLSDRWKQLTDNLGLRIRQAGVDRYAALLRNDKALLGADTLEGSIASSAWVLARMAPAAGGAVSALLNNGRLYMDTTEKVIDIKPGSDSLGKVLRQLGTPQEIDRFMGWIAANRSKRLAAEGRENLFTAEQIEGGIKLSSGKLKDGKNRSLLYKKVWGEFQQHRDDVLGIAEETGIITPEQRETWSEEFYVPFYRVMDDENVGGPSSGNGISRQQAYKKLKGGKQHLNDLLENTLLNFHHLIQASLKNQAAAQAMANAEQLGIAEKTTEAKRDKKMSTFVMVDGVKQWYDVNDALTFKAVSALADAGLNSPAMRIGRAFKRFFTQMTTMTPQFVVANAIRDTLSAMATSPTSAVPLKNAFKGALTYGNDHNKARMMASGGAFSFGHVYGTSPGDVKAGMTNTLRGAKVLADPALIPNILVGAWRKYHAATDFVENMNRAGIWAENQHKGKLKAAFEARDLMDFSAHGDADMIRRIIDVVPFLNARIQGLDKLYRTGGKPAIKTLFGKGTKADAKSFARFSAVTGALVMMSTLLYLRNKDDEEYRKLEDWQRDTYWVIRIGENMYFIPKPFEIGAIASMAERLAEQFVDPTVGGDKFAKRLGHVFLDTFAFNPTPQAIKPLTELYTNVNAFTGRPIEDQAMKRLSPSMRSRPETSRLADAASRGIETSLDLVGGKQLSLSPVQIDHLIQGYAGAVGATAVGLADTIWRRASGEELPARRWSEYQPIKRFYKDLTLEDNYTRYGTDFYTALKKADQAYADFQNLVKYGEEKKAVEMQDKQGDLIAMRGSLAKVQRTMSRINAEMKRIQMDKEMSSESKRIELDRLRSLRNLITEETGKDLEQQKVKRDAEKR